MIMAKPKSPNFPKVEIDGMPDWWTLVYRSNSVDISAQLELERRRIDVAIESATDARLDLLADHYSVARGDWKALAKAVAMHRVQGFSVRATSVPTRGRHAQADRFATVTMVEFCMLKKGDADGKQINVKAACRLLCKEKKLGQADALETKYHKCARELTAHPKARGMLNMWREHLPALLLDPEQRATVDEDLRRTERECFPARSRK
jgi:hypothetical protein